MARIWTLGSNKVTENELMIYSFTYAKSFRQGLGLMKLKSKNAQNFSIHFSMSLLK